MSTPEQHKINALEAELAEYAALPLADRLIPSTAALITAKENRLTRLLDAQAASAAASSEDGMPNFITTLILIKLTPLFQSYVFFLQLLPGPMRLQVSEHRFSDVFMLSLNCLN